MTSASPPNPHSADRELVQRVLARDDEAQRTFVKRMACVPRILAAQNAKLGRALDEHDLADLVQDVLSVIWQKLHQFEGRSSLESWSYGICGLELMNGLRRKKKLRRQVGDEVALAETADRPEAPRQWEFDDLHQAMERLSPEARTVVSLKHFEGLTLLTIGERLGLTESTVKARYYRGLRKLKECLPERSEP